MTKVLADGRSDDGAWFCEGLGGRSGTAVPSGQCVDQADLLMEQGRIGTA